MVAAQEFPSSSSSASMADPPTFELLALPYDLLVTVLASPVLGALEFARLEQTTSQLRALITDDTCWKRVFLRERRPPALKMPASWKAELARREEWSRTWRQRGYPPLQSFSPPQAPLSSSKHTSVALAFAPAV